PTRPSPQLGQIPPYVRRGEPPAWRTSSHTFCCLTAKRRPSALWVASPHGLPRAGTPSSSSPASRSSNPLL
ncbi:hypothetical protein NHX12_007925, partial [Muraenolepis orangiensis]